MSTSACLARCLVPAHDPDFRNLGCGLDAPVPHAATEAGADETGGIAVAGFVLGSTQPISLSLRFSNLVS